VVKDEWTSRIDAAFPTRSGSHEAYAVAMRMVGTRHSKGELVALVNWLLVEHEVTMARATCGCLYADCLTHGAYVRLWEKA